MLLTADHVLPGHAPVTLLRCLPCGAAFLRDLTPPDYEHDLTVLIDYYVEQGAGIDLMVSPLLRVPRGSVTRCLEIGCGFGFALDFCRHALGWEVLGVDPSSLAASGAAALGFPLLQSYFSAALDLGDDQFDLILCSEILEHVADPHPLLAAIRDRLAPDGLLVLSTPNLAIVNEIADKGAAGRALSPGFHLVLYDRGALAQVLAAAGFTDVIIEESSETLRVFAASSPAPLQRLQPPDADAASAMLCSYYTGRLDAVPAASEVACGFAYRHFKECVNAGLYEDAEASRMRLASVYRDRYRIDLDDPASVSPASAKRLPFNLTGTLFFAGILEFHRSDATGRAADYFAASIAAGFALLGELSPWGLHDGETEALLRQSRKHYPMALAARDPLGAVREIEALEATSGETGAMPAGLVAEARAGTFVRLVNAGAYDAARLVEPPLELSALEACGETLPGALDAPFCLGMLALQQSHHREAAEIFGRVYRAAGRRPSLERAELLWSSRYHQGLSLRRAGMSELAREALVDVAAVGARADLPPVPSHLADAARELLSKGDA